MLGLGPVRIVLSTVGYLLHRFSQLLPAWLFDNIKPLNCPRLLGPHNFRIHYEQLLVLDGQGFWAGLG